MRLWVCFEEELNIFHMEKWNEHLLPKGSSSWDSYKDTSLQSSDCGKGECVARYIHMPMKWQVVCMKWVDHLGITSVLVRGTEGYLGNFSFAHVSLNII